MSRIYQFGCLAPSLQDMQIINQELYKANTLWNNLVSLSHEQREMYVSWENETNKEINSISNEISSVEHQIDLLVKSKKNKNKQVRKFVKNKEVDLQIKELRTKKKNLIESKKHQRQNLKKSFEASDFEFKNRKFLKELEEKRKRNYLSEDDASYLVKWKQNKTKKGEDSKADKLLERKLSPRTISRINSEILLDMLKENQWTDSWKWKMVFDNWFLCQKQEIYKNCNLSTGVYTKILESFDNTIKEAKQGKRGFPKHHRFDGTGRIAVPLNKNKKITFGDLCSGNYNQLHIKHESNTTNGICTILAAKKDKGKIDKSGIFVNFPIKFHREIPPNAIISQAWIHIYKIGTDKQFELQLTVDDFIFDETIQNTTMVGGYDCGWRKNSDGSYRIGVISYSDGSHEELVLPSDIAENLEFCERLQSYIDKNFNIARDLFVYLRDNKQLPKNIELNSKYAKNWRSGIKLAKLTSQLVQYNFSDYEIKKIWNAWKLECGVKNKSKKNKNIQKKDLFPKYEIVDGFLKQYGINSDSQRVILYLEFWRRKNRHLYQRISRIRTRTLRRREDIYRNKAIEIFRKLEFLGIEDFDKSEVQKKSEDKKRYGITGQRICAVSEFISCLKSKFGSKMILVDKDQTTIIHTKCGYINRFDDDEKTSKILKCQKCFEEYDRDYNASDNILIRTLKEVNRLERERLGAAKKVATSRSIGNNTEKSNFSANLDL